MLLAGLTVLLVDDYPDSVVLGEMAMTMEGARVLGATDAEVGLRLLERDPIDVIVADLAMPGVDGFELMRRVRARPDEKGRTPSIALSVHATEVAVQRALRAGFDAHVAKSLPVDGLLAEVSRVAKRSGDRPRPRRVVPQGPGSMWVRLIGHAALEAAAIRGLGLRAIARDGGERDVSVAEAWELAGTDPSQVYVDVEKRVYTALWTRSTYGRSVSDAHHALLCAAATRWLTQHEGESRSITVLRAGVDEPEGLRAGSRSAPLAAATPSHADAHELVRSALQYVIGRMDEITAMTDDE